MQHFILLLGGEGRLGRTREALICHADWRTFDLVPLAEHEDGRPRKLGNRQDQIKPRYRPLQNGQPVRVCSAAASVRIVVGVVLQNHIVYGSDGWLSPSAERRQMTFRVMPEVYIAPREKRMEMINRRTHDAAISPQRQTLRLDPLRRSVRAGRRDTDEVELRRVLKVPQEPVCVCGDTQGAVAMRVLVG